jgi:hypothetical protein
MFGAVFEINMSFIYPDLMVKNRKVLIKKFIKWLIDTNLVPHRFIEGYIIIIND